MTMQKINRISLVLDRSGSMQGVMKRAIEALNNNIIAIRDQVQKTGQDATVSVTIFDDIIEQLWFNRSITAMQPLDAGSIRARGQTALFDAVGQSILQLRDLPAGIHDDVCQLLIVATDGEENDSKKFDASSIKKLMREVQATDTWTLSFLVPPNQAQTLLRMGIPDGNVMEWTSTVEGVKQYEKANREGIERFFVARSLGKKSVKSFYTDMSSVSAAEVRQSLTDLSKKAKVYTVSDDVDVMSFVQSKCRPFVKGCIFYQLTKRESNVQDYKKVLIMEKGKKAVYGGDDARRLLGLPDHNTSVVPGDHSGFDIFVQSTSNNRKLIGGTKAIYLGP